MNLLDRYERRALIAACVQALLLLGVLVYGLWAPSLGAKITWPTLVMLPAWAGLAWLTLTRPWEWGGVEPRRPMHRIWGYWEGWVVYGSVYGLTRLHGELFADAKELAAELRSWPRRHGEDAEAWAADTFGYLVLDGSPGGWIYVGAAFFVLALAWFLLPR